VPSHTRWETEVDVGLDVGAPFVAAATGSLLWGRETTDIPLLKGGIVEGRVGIAGASFGVGAAVSMRQLVGAGVLVEVHRTWLSNADPWLTSPGRTLLGMQANFSLVYLRPFVGFLVCPCDGALVATVGAGIRLPVHAPR
jgi:hypothetical protein